MEAQENLRQSSEKGWSRFAAANPAITLWAVDKKVAAILVTIGAFIPYINLLIILIAFLVCGINGRNRLYSSELYTEEQKSGINAFITRVGHFIKWLFLIGVGLFILLTLLALLIPGLIESFVEVSTVGY